uniref:Uncharacterized protein n=1 Tax=viral metagenome TaxID=1070528 RepID=A0A6H2A2L6_9ZZZZ
MKTYSVYNAGCDLLLENDELIVGDSPKSALENYTKRKVKRTTDDFEINFIIEEVKPLGDGKYIRLAGKPRLCYKVI